MKKKKFPKGSVCKPCWELKYCPYGYLVEFFPLYHVGDSEPKTEEMYEQVKAELKAATGLTHDDVNEYFQRLSILSPESNDFIYQFEPEDVACRVFGHACPVFFMQSGASETKEYRLEGRTVPRNIMLKVVRRDNHVCQCCHKYVPDDEVEFDHVIPYSKGGPTTVENIRLLCRSCNRRKSNSLKELLNF